MFRRLLVWMAIFSAVAAPAYAGTTEPARLARKIQKQTGKVLIVPIHGEIDRVQKAFVHRSLRDADPSRYDAVVFDLDTPGGRIDIMSEISDDILRLKVPTLAFVSHWAVSAGSYIAMSTDRIYMAPSSQMGAARALAMGPDGMPVQLPPEILEKITSVNRAQFRSLAQLKGYPAAIAEGMTDETLGVKLVSYDGAKTYMSDAQVAEAQNDPARKGKLTVIETVVPKGQLVALTATEAVKYDVASAIADSVDAVMKIEGVPSEEARRLEMTAGDTVIGILTMPQIVGLLILIGFGAVWLEMKMAGFGLPGIIAVVAFVLVFSSQFLVGNANALDILMFIIGVALLFIEIFVTPTFGMIGGVGVILVLLSLILGMQSFVVPTQPWQYQELGTNSLTVLGGMVGSIVILLIAIWLVPGTPIFRRFELGTELGTETGYGSGAAEEAPSILGQVGMTTTKLRPAGKMTIGEKTYSVVSESEFIEAGRSAKVIKVDGPRIVVEPVEPEKKKPPDYLA